MATTIHNDLTKANLNAWHIWWLYNASGNGGCLYDTSTKVWTKRLWVLGNYARFVRPGYVRVSTSGTVPSGVLVSAYQNPADGTVVVVAINSNTAATPLSLYVSGVVPCSITPWVTSATDSLASKSAITVSNARFSATLDPQSVTSFVGTVWRRRPPAKERSSTRQVENTRRRSYPGGRLSFPTLRRRSGRSAPVQEASAPVLG